MKVKDPAMLRRWRQQERFSQRELGMLVRRSQATIHLLETGGMRTLSEELAIAIAARLKRPWDELFELQEHEVMPIVANSADTMRIRPARNARKVPA
ncbi:helix-turn-helix transcriptional regulator [Sinomonas sp. P47F7]|uniref:helix-turn-helix transcriptional regulator n=1 Tax=Sinomonas sp. P47F7 TaxID=3410987 RepID=UPI003BF57E9F